MNISIEEMPRELERLLEENEQMEATIQSNIKSYNKLAKYSNELENRIDKAIEYIEERKKLNWYADGVFVYELLNILQGSDK